MKKGSVRWERVDLAPSAEEINRVLDRLLGPQNRSLNECNPSVNARLERSAAIPGGGRIKALHPVIAPPGRNAALNLRLFEQKPVQPEWLLARHLMNSEMMQDLADALRQGTRILISGGTRTGKTTLLSALCNFLPPAWRILKIEDPEEIWIDRPTVQTIEARPQAAGTEVRPYTLADGVDDAMRLSPDYLVIGEVRDGRAAQALFRALMTGHGGACTFHADSPAEAVARLAVLLGADAAVQKSDALPMIADAIDLLVQLGICNEIRLVTAISRVMGVRSNNTVELDPMWVLKEKSPTSDPQWVRSSPEVN
jgi:pilus assembly protein CpaF